MYHPMLIFERHRMSVGRAVATWQCFQLTGPTFCTRASERVYITTATGESPFAARTSPALAAYNPSAECGRLVLYSIRHFSITICASFSE
jgi:hypothetical protein